MYQLRKALSLAMVLDGITIGLTEKITPDDQRGSRKRSKRSWSVINSKGSRDPLTKGDKPEPGSNILDSFFGNLFFSSLIHIAFSLVMMCSSPRNYFTALSINHRTGNSRLRLDYL